MPRQLSNSNFPRIESVAPSGNAEQRYGRNLHSSNILSLNAVPEASSCSQTNRGGQITRSDIVRCPHAQLGSANLLEIQYCALVFDESVLQCFLLKYHKPNFGLGQVFKLFRVWIASFIQSLNNTYSIFHNFSRFYSWMAPWIWFHACSEGWNSVHSNNPPWRTQNCYKYRSTPLKIIPWSSFKLRNPTID